MRRDHILHNFHTGKEDNTERILIRNLCSVFTLERLIMNFFFFKTRVYEIIYFYCSKIEFPIFNGKLICAVLYVSEVLDAKENVI